MEWKEEYSVGIPEIDNQHKQLLQNFSEIEESIRLNKRWSDIHYAIVKLIQTARMHFSFEEAMMRIFGYPGLEFHLQEHKSFFDNLDTIERHSLKMSAETEMVHFLLEWLKEHMLGSDQGYAAHIFSGAKVVRHDAPQSGL
jgi:hemerythrin